MHATDAMVVGVFRVGTLFIQSHINIQAGIFKVYTSLYIFRKKWVGRGLNLYVCT